MGGPLSVAEIFLRSNLSIITYVVVLRGKGLYSNYLCLVAILVTETHCVRTGCDHVSANSTKKKFSDNPIIKIFYFLTPFPFLKASEIVSAQSTLLVVLNLYE